MLSLSARRRATLAVLIATSVGAAALPSLAQAQAFPIKPIRLICPFPPGGAVDIASRAIANEMSKTIGQTVVVENRPGAGGNVGGVEAARSAPDGYTVFMTTSGINAINPPLYGKMPFDPNKDLAPVSALVSLSNVLVLHPSVPANSVGDLLKLLRDKPGGLTVASSGNGTSIHMSAEMFKSLTKTDMLHVPYRGSAPAVTDLLAGQVQVMFDNIPSALPHIRAGKLRAIATTGAKRDPALPDLPTVAEAGVSGYESGVWFGLAVPAATPRDVVNRLSTEAVRGVKSSDFVKRMGDLGYQMLGTTPEVMADMLKVEVARWGPIVRASGAKVD
jgi:tripartite-type tricarboxylate transporter receptor subunit TctC